MIKVNSNLFLVIWLLSSASGLPTGTTIQNATPTVQQIQPPQPQGINEPNTQYTDSDSALNALNHLSNFQRTLFNQHLYTQQYLFNQFNQLRNLNPFPALPPLPNHSFISPNQFLGNLPFLHNPSVPVAPGPVNPPQYYDYGTNPQQIQYQPVYPNQNQINAYNSQNLPGQFHPMPPPLQPTYQTAPLPGPPPPSPLGLYDPEPPLFAPEITQTYPQIPLILAGQGPLQEPNVNQSQKPQRHEESKNITVEDANVIGDANQTLNELA